MTRLRQGFGGHGPVAKAMLDAAREEAGGDDAVAATILAEVAAGYLRMASAATARAHWPRDEEGRPKPAGEAQLLDNPSEVYPRAPRGGAS